MKKPPLKRFPSLYDGRKETLTDEEVILLFNSPFIVEEKLDGTLTIKDYGKYILMLEDMLIKHSVFYSDLPCRYILVDVIEKDTDIRLKREQRVEISQETGYSLPPYLGKYKGMSMYGARKALNSWVEECKTEPSRMGEEPLEGFVVKSELNMRLGGKYSRLDLTGVNRYDVSIKNRITGWKDDD